VALRHLGRLEQDDLKEAYRMSVHSKGPHPKPDEEKTAADRGTDSGDRGRAADREQDRPFRAPKGSRGKPEPESDPTVKGL
jgi:hypothetical protein